MAYADFVTAMMALFMVLWILSQGPEVRNSIATYFTDPKGIPILESSQGLIPNSGEGVMDSLPSPARLTGDGQGMGPKNAAAMLKTSEEVEEEKLNQAAKKIMKQVMAHPELSKLSTMISVEVSPEGLRIELSDQVEGTFFDIGSAQPKEPLKVALSEIVEVLRDLDNDVAIEGHTDARPYLLNASYSNWELSADRGNTVRRLMIHMNLASARISEIRAYADQNPLPGTDPFDGRNRRISVLVKSKVYTVGFDNQGQPVPLLGEQVEEAS